MRVESITLTDKTKININLIDNQADTWLVITHGVSEHHERHLFLEKLFGKKLNYLFYDLRGHGFSSGHPVYVDDFSQYAHDLGELIEYLKVNHGMKKYILFGHSLGGLITSDFMKNTVKQDLYPELVYLSSPPVTAGGPLGKIAQVAPMPLYDFLINLPLSIRIKLLPPGNLSHDPKVNQAAEDDPLSCNGLHTKVAFETMKAARNVFSGPLNLKCPAYISIGTGDKIVSPEAAIDYFTKVEKNFKLKIIKDAFHEIHHETDEYRLPYFEFLKNAIEPVL
jgi:alpha-beta hydrolase superfamily lysophospholipase